ncbi:TPA: hypothetical protein ACPSKE_001616 [Legionella feeleii]
MSRSNQTNTPLASDASLNSLKIVAHEKLARLNEHQKRFELFKSDLDLLRKRYYLRQSLIDTAAQWYGQKTIWQKIILTAEVIGIALVASLLFNTIALLAIISSYIGLIFLFNNHNARDNKREKDICENIVKMEKNLAESIESFNAVETRLVEVFDAIFQKNEALASYAADLDKKLEALNKQILSLQQAITGLAGVKEVLDASQALVQSSGEQFSLKLDELGKDVLHCTATIRSVTGELISKPDSSTTLTAVRADLSRCETDLVQLTATLKEQAQIAQTQSNQCESMQSKINTAFSGTAEATELLNELCDTDETEDAEISRLLRNTQAVHARAKLALTTKISGRVLQVVPGSKAPEPTAAVSPTI